MLGGRLEKKLKDEVIVRRPEVALWTWEEVTAKQAMWLHGDELSGVAPGENSSLLREDKSEGTSVACSYQRE